MSVTFWIKHYQKGLKRDSHKISSKFFSVFPTIQFLNAELNLRRNGRGRKTEKVKNWKTSFIRIFLLLFELNGFVLSHCISKWVEPKVCRESCSNIIVGYLNGYWSKELLIDNRIVNQTLWSISLIIVKQITLAIFDNYKMIYECRLTK